MKSLVLKEYLKEIIGEAKVKAALFYTFNFDVEFFENYLLPLFITNVNFTDNKIANSILWRQYQKELPHITVYCDFHAKSNTAPQLDYVIRPIDIKKSKDRKPCFHPKLSLILLDSGKLIIINGSNNLTDNGWCKNIEAVSAFTIENGENSFPREFKDSLWDFIDEVIKLYSKNAEYTDAENALDSFFRQRVYMKKQYNNTFINSIQKDFWQILSDIKEENGNSPFEEVEILSPYFSSGINLLKDLKEVAEATNIKCLIPYQGINEVAIEKNLFDKFTNEGITWCSPSFKYQGKGYRFNHSKVYRVKCKEYMYTIIGSYNFTEAAFDGTSHNGNIESAIIFKEPVDNWRPYLIAVTDWKGISWAEDTPNEEKLDQQRMDSPFLEFTLNWKKHTLEYTNHDYVDAVFVINNTKYEINKNKYKQEFMLDEKTTEYLADNSLITVKIENTEFYYYPTHIGIEFKPLSSSLARLNDGELLSIWEQLDKEHQPDNFADKLEKYIDSITNEAGDIVNNKPIEIKSTLNTMASHLSGLINLQKKIFDAKTKKNREAIDERIKYYLFIDNLDTLIGYRKLLKNMLDDGKIFYSFYWLLLNIIEISFYKKVRQSWVNENKLNNIYKDNLDIIKKEYTHVRNKLSNNQEFQVTKKHLSWARNMLESLKT